MDPGRRARAKAEAGDEVFLDCDEQTQRPREEARRRAQLSRRISSSTLKSCVLGLRFFLTRRRQAQLGLGQC